MHVTGTERAAAVIEQMRQRRAGALSITLGTGCCESTAPFLYEDYPVGPGAEPVGDVAGVPVVAPVMLRGLYGADETLVVDVVDELAESLSIETDLGVRLVLRSPDQVAASLACEVPAAGAGGTTASDGASASATSAGAGEHQELPEHLRGVRIR